MPATDNRTITHYHAHCRTCGETLGTARTSTLRNLVAKITGHRCGKPDAPARYDIVDHRRFTLAKLPIGTVTG